LTSVSGDSGKILHRC